jgi:hypothetical protein
MSAECGNRIRKNSQNVKRQENNRSQISAKITTIRRMVSEITSLFAMLPSALIAPALEKLI